MSHNKLAERPQDNSTPPEIAGQLEYALLRIVQASEGETGQFISYTLRADGLTRHSCYAAINTEVYGIGSTPKAAADEAIRKYGTEETRRAAAIAKLTEEAETLGLSVSCREEVSR